MSPPRNTEANFLVTKTFTGWFSVLLNNILRFKKLVLFYNSACAWSIFSFVVIKIKLIESPCTTLYSIQMLMDHKSTLELQALNQFIIISSRPVPGTLHCPPLSHRVPFISSRPGMCVIVGYIFHSPDRSRPLHSHPAKGNDF